MAKPWLNAGLLQDGQKPYAVRSCSVSQPVVSDFLQHDNDVCCRLGLNQITKGIFICDQSQIVCLS